MIWPLHFLYSSLISSGFPVFISFPLLVLTRLIHLLLQQQSELIQVLFTFGDFLNTVFLPSSLPLGNL